MKHSDVFRDLIIMALIDGKLSESEIALLTKRARRWGIDDACFAELMQQAISTDRQVCLPTTRQEREELLEEMLRMMAADGRLTEEEKLLFARVAVAMEFSSEDINNLINRLTGA